MKQSFVLFGLVVSLLASVVCADPLKNTLTKLLHEEESTPMVDLGSLSLSGESNLMPGMQRVRPATAVIAVVNGENIRKQEADAYLAKRTEGKISNFDAMAPVQQQRLLSELMLPKLVLRAAKRELSAAEKEAIYTRTWMQKEALKTHITDAQVQAAYEKIKADAAEHNATASIPPFIAIRDKLKLQMIEKAIVGKLMKDVKIKVF